jgi:hypothetical protein
MPIGASKVGALGGLVPGGTETFNAPGTFSIPPGVKIVSITGVGGTGNPGNSGTAGSSGNPGTGGGGGSGGAAICTNRCPTPPLHTAKAGGAGGSGGAGAGGAGGVCTSPPSNNLPVKTSQNPATAGNAGSGGSAGCAGNPGNTGCTSTALGQNFVGGAGGNGGAAGNAGNGGTGGSIGNGGGNKNEPPGYQANVNLSGNGGNGGSGGGVFSPAALTPGCPRLFVGHSPATCMNPFPFACGSFKFLGSSAIGGGGGAGDTNSGQTIPTYNLRNPSKLNGLAAPNQVGIGAGGPPAPPNGAAGAPIVPSPSTTGPGRVRAGLQFALGGNPGGGRGGIGHTVGQSCPPTTGTYKTYNGIWYISGLGGTNARAGGGGGAGGYQHGPCPNVSVSGGGGGGGGRGNLGNAGGNGGAGNPGTAATPSTANCVPVTPGCTAPITVASPGGQVVISWNPQ